MVRPANKNDINAIANLDRSGFNGNQPKGVAEKWIETHFNRQHGQYQYFVFEKDGRVISFIGWELLGGFARAIPTIELQKFATHPDYRGQGIGKQLMLESFEKMKEWVKKNQPDASQMHVVVWVAKHNENARKLYDLICNEGIKGERNMYGPDKDEIMLRGSYKL